MAQFRPGDYIAGIEEINFGGICTREMRGWITHVTDNKIYIKADDKHGGERITNVKIKTAYHCNRVVDWQQANKREIPAGTVVRHFKNKEYIVVGYAEHVDGGRAVYYQAKYGENKYYVREYAEFMSEVDREKYPEVTQKYRFEVVID